MYWLTVEGRPFPVSCRGNYARCMHAARPEGLQPPEGLRPAQLGIVLLGEVILGHVSATLVDLAQRGFLSIAEIRNGTGHDWQMTDLRGQRAGSRPLRFEATLLEGMFGQQPVVRLSQMGDEQIPVLNRFRANLQRDAVRHGWLRRWHRGQRTPRGEQLLRQIHAFRWELRAIAAAGDSSALAGLAPYAMIFGLVPSPRNLKDTLGNTVAPDHSIEVAWSQYDRFAQSWLTTCAGFSTGPDRGHRSSSAHSSDFVHQWSASHDHHRHPGHGHNSGDGGYSGGHESYGAGHHADFGGAGHGGF